MNIIIMGCGRMGEQLARSLLEDNHFVTVIDSNSQNLRALGSSFKGRQILGIGFDREILISAGIESADAFAATSPSDNMNVVAARTARLFFHVPKVVARLYDPRRAEIYQRLGLLTISATTWGAERIRELLTHEYFDPVQSYGRGEVSTVNLEVPSSLAGKQVKHLFVPGEVSVIAITRQGNAFIPLSGTELLSGDILHLSVDARAMERLRVLFNEG
jgi:trk system potassium uptake protein TrkA